MSEFSAGHKEVIAAKRASSLFVARMGQVCCPWSGTGTSFHLLEHPTTPPGSSWLTGIGVQHFHSFLYLCLFNLRRSIRSPKTGPI